MKVFFNEISKFDGHTAESEESRFPLLVYIMLSDFEIIICGCCKKDGMGQDLYCPVRAAAV